MNNLRIAFVVSLAVLIYSTNVSAFIWLPKEEARGTHTDSNAGEGTSMAMAGDVLVVGAPRMDRPAGDVGVPAFVGDAGGVEIYHRRIGGWALDQTLYSPQPATNARFGASVAIVGDMLVVGEPAYTPQNIPSAVHNGRTLVYVRSPSTGRFVFRKEIFRLGVTIDANARMPEYGTSVDVAATSGREYGIAVGAPGEDGPDYGDGGSSIVSDIGAVLVVRLHTTQDGDIQEDNVLDSSWYILNRRLQGSSDGFSVTAYPDASFFGDSVGITGDTWQTPAGEFRNYYMLGVGAPDADVRISDNNPITMPSHGAAHLFHINSPSNPSPSDVVRQEQYIALGNGNSLYLPFFIASTSRTNHDDEHTGTSIDVRQIEGDVEMIVGAPRAPASGSPDRTGAAYYFRRYASDCCLRGVQTLYAESGMAEDHFGAHVVFAADRLLIGAPDRDEGDVFVHEGVVYAYEKIDADRWGDRVDLTSEVPLTGAIAGSTDWIAAGSPYLHGQTQTWQRGWTLAVATPTHGVIQIVPPIWGVSPAVVCPPDCDLEFENGRHLSPTAIADDGYFFQRWTAPGTECDGETSQTCPFVVGADTHLAANFIINVGNTRTITLGIAAGSGTITLHADNGTEMVCPNACDGIFSNGTVLTIVAEPDIGFEFAGWSGACQGNLGTTCSFPLNTSTQVTAAFAAVDGNRSVNVQFAGNGPGLAEITSPAGDLGCTTNDNTPCSVSEPADTPIEIFACAVKLSMFTGWGGDCSGTGACAFALDADKEITATFETSDELFFSGFEPTHCPQGSFTPPE